EEIDRDLSERQRFKSRLERIAQALPDIVRRRELMEAGTALADAPLLRPGFADERLGAQQEMRDAERSANLAGDELREIEEERAALDVPEAVLAESATIESIVQRLGGYHQSRQKAADLRGERRSYIAMATTILRDLGHDLDAAREADLWDVEALRLTTPARSPGHSPATPPPP